MIEQVLGTDNYELGKRLLDAAALRHEALATNIANLETPGFKRIDLAPDFARQLADLSANPGSFTPSDLQLTLAEDRTALSSRADGNNVQLDRELVELNRNSVEYDFLAQYTSDCLRRLKTAITGRVT
jgi:flagellar basal-body rod protein FlgB